MKKNSLFIRIISSALCIFAVSSSLCGCGITLLEESSDVNEKSEQISLSSESKGQTYVSEEQSEEPSEETSDITEEVKRDFTLRITEVMAASTLCPSGGNWAEVYNYGEKSVDLSKVTVGGANGSGIIGSGEYALVYSDITAGHTVSLCHISGIEIDYVDVPKTCKKDMSYALDGIYSGGNAGSTGFVVTTFATPGYANSAEGYEKYLSACGNPSPIEIYEFVSVNLDNYEQDGEYYDWLEIKNVSDKSVNLSSYCLSDDYSKLDAFTFPDISLAAGKTVTVFCSGDATLKTSLGYHADFKISSDTERLYLSSGGKLIDSVIVTDIPVGKSYGRIDGESGFWYFDTPTPGKDNENGYRFVASAPVPSEEAGVYSDTVTVSFEGDGDVYFTTDGSKPTRLSEKYTEPITVAKSSVIRAFSACDGKADGETVTFSYIIASHTLPVASIAIDPDDFYSEESGIYNDKNCKKKWEKEINLSFFGLETGNVSIDCGLKLAGEGSRELPKKSFALKFRSSYGESELEYDIFGDGEVTTFNSLKLRAGEDYIASVFRDELITTLAGENTEAKTQKHRFCVLYVNGEYFGIYSFRDKLDEDYVAYTEGCDTDDVDAIIKNNFSSIKADYGSAKEYEKLLEYIKANDMTDSEKYDYVKSQIDFESLIDWVIAEVYTGNRDLANDRCYRLKGGKWKWMFYDLDWAFYYQDNAYFLVKSSLQKNTSDIVKKLFENSEFRDLYLTRLAYQLKNVYTYDNISSLCDEYAALLESEIPANAERWKTSYNSWKKYVEKIKTFAKERYENVVSQTVDYFDLTASEKNKYFG